MSYTLRYVESSSLLAQAEGRTADDRPFYFRARYGQWTLEVGEPGWDDDYLRWAGPAFTDDQWDQYIVARGVDAALGDMNRAEIRAVLDTHLSRIGDR